MKIYASRHGAKAGEIIKTSPGSNTEKNYKNRSIITRGYHTSYICQWVQPRPLVYFNRVHCCTLHFRCCADRFKSHSYWNNNKTTSLFLSVGLFVHCFAAAKQQQQPKNQENVSELEDVNWFSVVSWDLFTPIYP